MTIQHAASQYIQLHVAPPMASVGALRNRSLTAVEARMLRILLEHDAQAYALAAAYSLACAVDGLGRSLTTWPTVQLYYSVFYSLRALLALQGHGLYYHGHSPFLIECLAGKAFAKPPGGKRAGTTHGAVLESFKALSASHFLNSQPIGMVNAVDWLAERRVEANYLNARFWEPDWPDHFSYIRRNPLRRTLGTYIQDSAGFYAFDPDHAMLAYPVRALASAVGELKVRKLYNLDEVTRRSLTNLFRDSTGVFPDVVRFFSPGQP